MNLCINIIFLRNVCSFHYFVSRFVVGPNKTVAPTPIGHGGHVPPTFTNGWAWGHHEQENSKEETD